KSAGVLRDRDILERMAERNLVKIALSITTLDRSCARTMEPRASTPARRLEAISALSAAGVRTCVMVAPIIPALTDHELEAILGHAAEAGAHEAGYVMLRLPLEIADLFNEWLQEHYPDRAKRIMSHVRDMHGGSVYRSDWFQRQSGRGAYATLIARRFRLACTRLGLARERAALTTSHFAADFAAAVACSQPDLFAFENRV
ncbi:MAG: radical SAM protein, partial [Pseudomonadota bacterium]